MRSKPLKLAIQFWGLARPRTLQGVGKQLKIKCLKDKTKLGGPHTMAQGGGKPSFCQRGLEELEIKC